MEEKGYASAAEVAWGLCGGRLRSADTLAMTCTRRRVVCDRCSTHTLLDFFERMRAPPSTRICSLGEQASTRMATAQLHARVGDTPVRS
jgi:hypothetical protein